MDLAPYEQLLALPDDVITAFRERLRALGYDGSVLAETEAIAPLMLDAVRVPLVQWRLRQKDTVRADVTRLFVYADAITEARAREAFGDRVFDALLGAGGLARSDGGGIRSPLRVLPVEDLVIVGDPPERGGDTVMSPGPTTLHILNAMPARCRGSVLDVGCGPGTIALVAARRGAENTVGCDISERAVLAARFNAKLNGLRAEFVAGDLLEPVKGRRFDLVVAQPPYVIRPPDAEAVTFLHGGSMGDEIAMRLMSGIDAVMAPHGRAIVLFDTPVRPNDALHARVRAALGQAPTDLIVLSAPGVSIDMQAVVYAAMEVPDLGARFGDSVRKYARHLYSLGVAEFQHALLVLRRGGEGAPAGGRFTVTLPLKHIGHVSGAALDTLFESIDAAGLDDDALARQSVRAAPAARWIEERDRPDLALDPARKVRFVGATVAAEREISEAGFVLVGALDASDSVEDAVGLYAEACGATPAEVRRQVLAFVRESLARGLVELRPRG